MVKKVAQDIADIIGRPDLLQLGALPSRSNEPARLVANVHRLTKEVDWHPRYSLRDGLKQTIEWWKENRKENL